MVRIIGTRISDIIEYFVPVQTVAFGRGQETDGPERAFGINVETLALATAHIGGELAGDRELVTKLRLARAKLAEKLCD